MAYEALEPYRQDGLECRFICNIDPTDAGHARSRASTPPRRCSSSSSKTFGTLETLTNARLCKAWLLDGLAGQDARRGASRKHFVAVSTALDKVEDFGIDPANAFGFWDWVGGRYSVELGDRHLAGRRDRAGAVRGVPRRLHAMDEHFRTAEPARNVPLLMGLLNVWYANFLGCRDARRAAVLAAAAPVPGVPPAADHGVQRQGRPLGRHRRRRRHRRGVLGRARHQRAARVLPADPPGHPARPGRLHRVRQPGLPAGATARRDVHELFLANFFAQTRALAFGKTADEVRAEGTAEDDRHGPGVHRQPADHLDHGAGADARPCWAS